jgi:hypothetical protein
VTGWLGVALLVVILALVACSWWLGTLCASVDPGRLGEPRRPVMRIRAPRLSRATTPRQVVILDECDDGVFRAI